MPLGLYSTSVLIIGMSLVFEDLFCLFAYPPQSCTLNHYKRAKYSPSAMHEYAFVSDLCPFAPAQVAASHLISPETSQMDPGIPFILLGTQPVSDSETISLAISRS